MYNTLKRMTPLVVIVLGVTLDRKRPTRNVVIAVAVTVSGCVVAGAGDLSFDLGGYIFAIMSCLLQAGYLFCVQKTQADKGLDSATILLYNSLLTLPPLVLYIFLDGSFQRSTAQLMTESHDVGFHISMGGTLLIGVLLNYALFLCTKCNSALTTTIVGVMKGVVSTSLGFFLLGGVKLSAVNLLGIALNTCGGVRYAQLKYVEKRAQAAGTSDPKGSDPNRDMTALLGKSVGESRDSFADKSPMLRPTAKQIVASEGNV